VSGSKIFKILIVGENTNNGGRFLLENGPSEHLAGSNLMNDRCACRRYAWCLCGDFAPNVPMERNRHFQFILPTSCSCRATKLRI